MEPRLNASGKLRQSTEICIGAVCIYDVTVKLGLVNKTLSNTDNDMLFAIFESTWHIKEQICRLASDILHQGELKNSRIPCLCFFVLSTFPKPLATEFYIQHLEPDVFG